PIRADARCARRRRRLGPDAACVVCGESDLVLLTRGKRRVIQAHHVAGRRHDAELTAVLCLNCHARATEALERVGVPMRRAATTLERLIFSHRARAAFFRQLSDAELRNAAFLEQILAGFDAEFAGWRRKPWTQSR